MARKKHNGTGRTHRVKGSQQPQYFLGHSREFWKTVMGPKPTATDTTLVLPETDVSTTPQMVEAE